jgi:hypothetical protein
MVVEKDIAATMKLLYQTGQVLGFSASSAFQVTSNHASRAMTTLSEDAIDSGILCFILGVGKTGDSRFWIINSDSVLIQEVILRGKDYGILKIP